MKTCDTCKWWDGSSPARLDIGDGFHFCVHPKNDKDLPDGFGVSNGEPFGQGLFATGPKFGCLHWASKIEEAGGPSVECDAE